MQEVMFESKFLDLSHTSNYMILMYLLISKFASRVAA